MQRDDLDVIARVAIVVAIRQDGERRGKLPDDERGSRRSADGQIDELQSLALVRSLLGAGG